MTINLDVQADLIDIRTDIPRQSDIFLVDTNVWFWLAYTNASASSPSARRRVTEYSAYLNAAKVNGATLTYSGLVLAELAHLIEKTECKIYNNRFRTTLDLKEFRHNHPSRRANVVAEVQLAWELIKQLAVPLPLTIDEPVTDAALDRFKTQSLDGYDLLMLEAITLAAPDRIRVITHDTDFATVPGIQVFTSSYMALQAASAVGKVLTR